jgi:hypothetical protein
VKGCALRIEGGDFHLANKKTCPRCHRSPASQQTGESS